MIRKLTEADRQTTLDFLLEEPEINLFAIGDIERHGFDAPFQTLWGDFEPDTDHLQAVLLRYETNYIPYYKSDHYNPAVFASLILTDPDFRMLSGREPLVRRLQAAISTAAQATGQPGPVYLEKSTYFCKLTTTDRLFSEAAASTINTTTESRLRENLETGAARATFIEDDAGRLLTVAQTSAENSASAMIVGVATHPDHRGQGLMSANLSALCRDLLAEGKTLCLFYDNPRAGAVYHRLGFETIDQWLMLIKR